MTTNEILSCLKKEVQEEKGSACENCIVCNDKGYLVGFNEGLLVASQKIREEILKTRLCARKIITTLQDKRRIAQDVDDILRGLVE